MWGFNCGENDINIVDNIRQISSMLVKSKCNNKKSKKGNI